MATQNTNPTETLMAAHRAMMENAQSVGMKGFEAASRLFEMQTQAAQGVMGASTAGGAPTGTPGDPLAMTRGAAEYTQRAAQLMWETQTEMMKLLQSQASQLQALFNEMMAASLQNAASAGAAATPATARGGRRGGRGAAEE